MSEFITEKEFEFKCYLENHNGELATNMKQALDYSTLTEYDLNGIRYSKITQFNTLPM